MPASSGTSGVQQKALQGGVLDEGERWHLEELRKELGIDSDEALEQLRSVLEEARKSPPTVCPNCGKSVSLDS